MRIASLALLLIAPSIASAADPFDKVCDEVNTKMVKLFGAGGFSRLNNFGTGILISKEGHILTVASQLLDTSDLVVHLYDGRRMKFGPEAAMQLPPMRNAAQLAGMLAQFNPGMKFRSDRSKNTNPRSIFSVMPVTK